MSKQSQKNLDKVKKFLKKCSFKEIIENKAKCYVELPLEMKFEGAPGTQAPPPLTLKVRTIVDEKWINAKCLLFFKQNLPPDPNLNLKLFSELLKANFMLNEVTYSVDDQENIWVETDMPVDTTFDNFDSEFKSILFGALHFFNKIIPNVGKAMQELKKVNTYEPPAGGHYS